MIELIEPKIFSAYRLISGVTLRSQKNYPVTGFTCGNEEVFGVDLINFHRQELASQLGFPLSNLKFQKQVHGDNIRFIDENSEEDESDALITNHHGIILCVKIADCAAILIFDPLNNAIAAVHSGWKGTKLGITVKAINVLNSRFDSKPENLITYISPCASGKNYEVGEDFNEMFPGHVHRIGEKYFFDNVSAIKEQLINAGLNQANIETSGICSISDIRFHSFRRDKSSAGRMVAFIGLI